MYDNLDEEDEDDNIKMYDNLDEEEEDDDI